MELLDGSRYGQGVWPRCLAEFQLDTLRLHSSRDIGDAAALRKEFRKLHSGLRTLDVKFSNAPAVFFTPVQDSSDSQPSTRKNATKRAKTTEVADDQQPHQELWDMNETHGGLEHLFIRGVHPVPVSLKARELALLPSSLLSLVLDDPKSRIDVELQSLPQTLQLLSLKPDSVNRASMKLLPPSLTDAGSIPMWNEAGVEALAKDLSILPNLRVFPHQGEFFNEDDLLKIGNPADNDIWPAMFKSLSFGSLTTPPIDKLPATLVSLYLNDCSDATISVEWITTMCPSTLQILHAESFDWSEIEANHWSQNLTTLGISNDETFNAAHFHRLPRHLKDLSISLCNFEEGEEAGKSLTEEELLEIGKTSLSQGLDAEIWASSALKSAHSRLRMGEANAETHTKQYADSIESGALFGLPLSITTLVIQNNMITYPMALPPRLTKINVAYHTLAPTAHYGWAHIPPTLTDVYLGTGRNAQEQAATSSCPMLSSLLSFAPNLQLSRLEVRCPSASSAENILECLPASLRYLTIWTPCAPIHYSKFELIPSTLFSLDISCKSFEPENHQWAKYLPRGLVHLQSHGMLLAGSALEELPTNLETCFISTLNLTVDHLLGAPCSLRKFRAKAFTSDSPQALPDWKSERISNYYVPFWRIWHSKSTEEILKTIEAL